MTDPLSRRIAHLTGATSATKRARIQTLWGGYGEAARYDLTGAELPSVVVKHVKPGKGSGRGHDRKLRSYEVELAWYTEWASRCGEAARVPRCLHAERRDGEWLFILEDLDAAGFSARHSFPARGQLDACLRWLAAFHATFMGERPRGLWKIGTYWHLKTRPDEHKSMARGPLRDAAAEIDARLNAATFLTFVHGDAKPANFCFSRDGQRVAAVDFQYVGGGCGMKDVAYLLASEPQAVASRGLDVYFKALRAALRGSTVDGAAVEAEWRALYPWACADLQRFLDGWSPGWVLKHGRAWTRKVLAILGR